jgi:large conductance mechanosensitive channel
VGDVGAAFFAPRKIVGRVPLKGIGTEFKEFTMRGNVVDLAVAIVIGSAFLLVINSFVDSVITPLIALLGGQPDFSGIGFDINDTRFPIGVFLTALISFLIVALVVFFFVVKPLNYMMERSKREQPADPTERKCPACLSDVPVAATRCAFCTSDLPPVTAQVA